MAERKRNPGINIPLSSGVCSDINCPFHGNLKIRGKTFTGTVISDRMQKSVAVEWETRKIIPKFERYRKRKTRITAHNPQCINATEGDNVKIAECRPLSKTKNFVVIQIIGKEKTYGLEKEALEEGKHREIKEQTKKE